MTKRLDVTARQISAICKGAEDAGKIAEIKIGNAFIRLVDPAHKDAKQIDNPGKGYF